MINNMRELAHNNQIPPQAEKDLKNLSNKKIKIQKFFFSEFDTLIIEFPTIYSELETKFNNALQYDHPIALITDSDDEKITTSKYLETQGLSFEVFNANSKTLKSKIYVISFQEFKNNLLKLYHIDFKLYLSTSHLKFGDKSEFVRRLIKLKRRKTLN